MKYIVTGGAGFIGSHLVERLAKNNEVIVIDNFSIGKKKNLKNIKKNIKIINADIRNLTQIKKYFKNIDCVFHLAALADIVPSIDNPDDYYSTNVSGTYNVIKLSVSNNVKRFVYSASSSCYGIPKKYPTPENSKISPQYPYALTKRLGEEIVLHFGKVYNINTTSLRFFNVYGPRARTSGTYGAVFGVFLAQKLSGKPFTLVGNGNQTRDFTYVTDIVDALILVSKSNNLKNEIFNIGSGKTISINKIIQLLKGDVVKIPKRPGEPEITFADIKKIKKFTNWKPKVGISEGISKLLKNINDWSDAPVWTPSRIEKATKNWFKYLK
ncbi:NAD-dependent epimerase/dehydratase family protein [Candidatus Pelagibacter sp.]|uniref:NAD-dependent epimerase/dehydratase family protein n=1 Tax=Candidatus Pelagibacter sp. TaxID=2024849 RepID=UPI003F855E20